MNGSREPRCSISRSVNVIKVFQLHFFLVPLYIDVINPLKPVTIFKPDQQTNNQPTIFERFCMCRYYYSHFQIDTISFCAILKVIKKMQFVLDYMPKHESKETALKQLKQLKAA